jgi:hypothetical protein
MDSLRTLSGRPEILIDNNGFPVVGAVDKSRVGRPGPFGRERMVTAIPTNEAAIGPVQLAASQLVHDTQAFYLADPAGNLLGAPAVWIHRLLTARWTQDTRRLT